MKMEMLINELQEIADGAFTIPLSGGKTVVNTERLNEIIEEMRTNLPSELKQAKAIAADRTNIINKSKEEAELIVQQAEERSKAMVAQNEIVKQAQQKSDEIIFNAKNQAEEIKSAANKYIDSLMQKADEDLSKNLQDLKKTRQNLANYQKKNAGTKVEKKK